MCCKEGHGVPHVSWVLIRRIPGFDPERIGSILHVIGYDRHVPGLDQARVEPPRRLAARRTRMVLSEVVRSTKWVVENAKHVEIIEEGERCTSVSERWAGHPQTHTDAGAQKRSERTWTRWKWNKSEK